MGYNISDCDSLFQPSLSLAMIIRIHKCLTVLLRNNETFKCHDITNMRFYLEMRQKIVWLANRNIPLLSACFLSFSGSEKVFTVTSLQPIFKIPDLAVSNPPTDIQRLSFWSIFLSVSLSFVRADRSCHIVKPTTPHPTPTPFLLCSTSFKKIINFSWNSNLLCDGGAQMAHWLRLGALWYSPVMLQSVVPEGWGVARYQSKKTLAHFQSLDVAEKSDWSRFDFLKCTGTCESATAHGITWICRKYRDPSLFGIYINGCNNKTAIWTECEHRDQIFS